MQKYRNAAPRKIWNGASVRSTTSRLARVSSHNPTIDTSDVALIRLAHRLTKGGAASRIACGKITIHNINRRFMPRLLRVPLRAGQRFDAGPKHLGHEGRVITREDDDHAPERRQ